MSVLEKFHSRSLEWRSLTRLYILFLVEEKIISFAICSSLFFLAKLWMMLLVVLTPCWKIVVVAGGTLTYNVSICKWAFLMDRISDKKSQQHRMYLHWSIFWLGKSASPFLPSIFRSLFLKRFFFFVFASFHQQKLVANLIKVLKERKYFHCSKKGCLWSVSKARKREN